MQLDRNRISTGGSQSRKANSGYKRRYKRPHADWLPTVRQDDQRAPTPPMLQARYDQLTTASDAKHYAPPDQDNATSSSPSKRKYRTLPLRNGFVLPRRTPILCQWQTQCGKGSGRGTMAVHYFSLMRLCRPRLFRFQICYNM